MKVEELAFTFDCQGTPLVGILHRPAQPHARGVLAVVAGGPQYRAGCCRQLVYMARALSAQGYAVMRFDYRGMGDAGGEFLGFQHVEDDLRAALEAFRKTVPELKEVVFWGGCDAASAGMIHAHRFPIVTDMILGNPYAHSNETEAAVTRQYYWQRLRDKDFWANALKLRVNPFKAAQSALGSIFGFGQKKNKPTQATTVDNVPFTERMLQGMQQFRGKSLLVMSGQSLTSQEFDVLASASPKWRKLLSTAAIERCDIAEADQAFSTIEARDHLIDAALQWLKRQV